MYCPRCGSKCIETEKFCKSCGEPLKNEWKENQYYQSSDNYNYNYNYSNITDESLESAYVGSNYEKIKSGKFSFPAFLFGIYYLIYRKMWLYALGFLALIIMGNILISEYIYLLDLGLFIASGIGFNKLYMQHVTKKIEKLKDQYSNKSKEELLKICKNKGGVSVGGVIVAIFLVFIIAIIVVSILLGTELMKDINLGNDWLTTKDNYKMEELSYEPPTNYELSKYSSETYKSYSSSEENKYCSFSIETRNTSIYSYQTEEEYLKKTVYASIGDIVSEVQKVTINNRDWKYITVETDNRITYHYAILFKDKIYDIEYYVRKENDNCKEDYEEFINTLRLIDGELATS